MPYYREQCPRALVDLIQNGLNTPSFVLDLTELVTRINAVSSECGKYGAKYSYPVKANSSPEVLNLVASLDVELDVCSIEELNLVMTSGCKSSRINFCGAGIDSDELQKIAASGAFPEFDSIDEVAIFAETFQRGEFGIRLAVPPDLHDGRYWPYANKFGLTCEDLPALAAILNRSEMRLTSLHIHGIFPVQQYAGSLENILPKFATLASPLRRLNFGGGWGDGLSDNWLDDTRPHLAACCDLARKVLAESIFFEAGEAVVGPSGWLITRIRSVKTRHSPCGVETVVICDTPYTFAVGAGLVRALYPVAVIDEDFTSEPPVNCTIFGRNNTPYDLIRSGVPLCGPRVGLTLAIGGQGAYVSSAMGRFNSRAVPATVVI